ncbi:aspartate/glutamate racemase family protein [Pseudomonas sp. TH31]|uniref:aspartate/glutamate racemase family protein n=1 Tax=Pseudomonas sp. TH31 TaxID=2796396 RepID=UPI001912FEBD|nr:aspartate/glutamate racemase family protein [Pseudomonas sp. TH31]MBK5413418.1 hypothetical protein [Pseudomonas sp. TH31]
MRIGFIHTVGFLVENFREQMRQAYPHADCFHILNESLLQDLLRRAPQALVYRRVVEQILLADQADADLIVVTCSSTSPSVDIARTLTNKTILKIDDPMAALAVRNGPRIGLLCTSTSTVEPSSALLCAHAAQQGVDIDIQVLAVPEAYQALLAGDRAIHDQLIESAVTQLLGKIDVLMLAQASLAHLRERLAGLLPVQVLASPSLLMEDIGRHITEYEQRTHSIEGSQS